MRRRIVFAGLMPAVVLLVAVLLPVTAYAGGPRFVTGTQYAAAPPGQMMAFYTEQPLYFTDPGALNANVSHAQADAMVAAAANVWNVPTSMLTLAQGGTLAEHVSAANSYFDGNGEVFPADVQATNYLSIPIAVIYDTDGSITDLLLGSGASDPSGCRQSGVTQSVDGFGASGTIEHAVIVLNGRCVGTTPEQLLQMQYQVMRAFGRVIGLAWSQLNDNVFTGVPMPNADQVAYWPVMHPIDVICGPYTYQCMPNPFMLRIDDLSALALLYPVTAANVTPGKTLSGLNAVFFVEYLEFPSGQGMESVNFAVRYKPATRAIEDFQVASGVSGIMYQENGGNPVTGFAVPAGDNGGTANLGTEGEALIARVPVPGEFYYNMPVTAEPINPLYSGEYAIAPYDGAPVAMSGPPATDNAFWGAEGTLPYSGSNLVVAGAASSCNPGNDGVEGAPGARGNSSGWWTGLLCGPGHVSWWSASVKAGRSWTLETTASDEAGASTTQKMRPMMGVWNASDPTGTLPTVAATAAPFNSMSLGMTQLAVASAAQDSSFRIAIADEFGAGRPDFAYSARMLYADSVSPAVVGAGGGRITITGTGFRKGNRVTVNGAVATVLSWTSTQIVATAPTIATAGVTDATPIDIAVTDLSTAGQTVMSGVLTYSASLADTIQVVSAPAAVETGVPAATPFTVRVFASDGITPVAGASVQFAVVSGGATLAACGAATTCILATDSSGLAQTTVTGTVAGPIVLSATEMSGGAAVEVTLNDVDPVRTATIAGGSRYLAAGAAENWSVSLAATRDGTPAAGATVAWSETGALMLGASQQSSAQGSTDSSGTTSVAVQTAGLAAGMQGVVTGCVWTTVCASATAYGIAPSQWAVGVASGAGQSIGSTAMLAPVTLLVTDGAGHVLVGAAVQVYQTVDAWEGACPAQGRCPAAPVLAVSQTTATSDANGLVTVTPLEVPGVAQVIQIAASTGAQGFVELTLIKTP